MKSGIALRSGDVILAKIQFTDTFEIKTRPALVLYEELNNVVIAGITSNTSMKGIPLTKKEGVMVDSVIKMNYIFTVAKEMVNKTLFHLSEEKKKMVYNSLNKRISMLIS